MKCFALILSLVCFADAHTQTLDPLVDHRYQGVVIRNLAGTVHRSPAVVKAFKQRWACPSTGLHISPCLGWAVDHVIPLDCGGVDAVWNMQWLPNEIKSAPGPLNKDHFERRIYGGNNLSKGCP